MMTATAVHINQSLSGRDLGPAGVGWRDVGGHTNAFSQQDAHDNVAPQYEHYNQQNSSYEVPPQEQFAQMSLNSTENQAQNEQPQAAQEQPTGSPVAASSEPVQNQQAGESEELTGIEINTDIIPTSQPIVPQPSIDSSIQPMAGSHPFPPNPVLMQQPPLMGYPYAQMMNGYPHPHPLPNGQIPPMTMPMAFSQHPFAPSTLPPPPFPIDQQMGAYNGQTQEGGQLAPSMAMVAPPMMPMPMGQGQGQGHPPPLPGPPASQAPLMREVSQQSVGSAPKGGYDFVGPRHLGTVKWFSANRGYGFLMPDQGQEDVFIHQSDILSHGYRSLRQGCRVEYCVEPFENKSKAVQVTGPNGNDLENGRQQFQRQGYGQYYNGMPNMYAYPAYNGGQGSEQNGMYQPYYYGYQHQAYPQPHPSHAPVNSYGIRNSGSNSGGWAGGRRKQDEHPLPYNSFSSSQNNEQQQQEQNQSSGLQIVVHNLAWACSWQELKDAFGAWNPVRADVIQDGQGRSRGFGVIKFSTKEDAQAAIEAMSNQLVAGRPVTVRLDKFA